MGPLGTPQLRRQLQAVHKQSGSAEPATSEHLLRHRAQPLSSHRALSQAHTAPGALLCCQEPLTLPPAALSTHRSLQDSQSSWDLRERPAAVRQHSLAQNGLGDPIKLFASIVWFYKMHIPRKHHFISICAPNHLPQPLLAENQNVSEQIQQVLQDRHQQMLLLPAKGLSANSPFTFTGF